MDICYIFALRKTYWKEIEPELRSSRTKYRKYFSWISERTKATYSHLGRGVSMVVFTFCWAYFAVCLYGVITCERPLLSFSR